MGLLLRMNAVLESVAKRKVRAVVRTDSPASQAVFDLTAGSRTDWTSADWKVLLVELDSCEDTVSECIEKRNWL